MCIFPQPAALGLGGSLKSQSREEAACKDGLALSCLRPVSANTSSWLLLILCDRAAAELPLDQPGLRGAWTKPCTLSLNVCFRMKLLGVPKSDQELFHKTMSVTAMSRVVFE